MILYRNRLVFGIIKSIFGAVFGVLNKILSVFNLQPTALLLLIGLVLYFTGTMDRSPVLLTVFQLVVIVSVVYAVISTIKSILGIEKKVKRSKGAQIVNNAEQPTTVNTVEQSVAGVVAPVVVEQEKPVYFSVKQNPEYVMAEYKDRYELFRIVNGSLKKIRTDYKNGEEPW